jgi:hypothetical protein
MQAMPGPVLRSLVSFSAAHLQLGRLRLRWSEIEKNTSLFLTLGFAVHLEFCHLFSWGSAVALDHLAFRFLPLVLLLGTFAAPSSPFLASN